MTDQIETLEESAGENWRPKILALGALIGALTGLGAAYLLVQRAEKEGGEPNLSTKEGITLGLLVFGLLRQVSQLGGGDSK
jgi:hypothetical protein